MLLAVLLSFFSASLESCLICAWPHNATVNSRGQCVISSAPQANLSAGCYIWCDAWARQNGVSQTATPMVSSVDDANAGRCICQRASTSGTVQYTWRTTSNCPADQLGASDEDMQRWMPNMSAMGQAINDAYQGVINNYMTPGSMAHAVGTASNGQTELGTFDVNLDIDVTSIANQSANVIWNQIKPYFAQQAARNVLQDSIQGKQLSAISDSVSTLMALARNGATGEQIDNAAKALMYAINSRGGGGSSTTDLTPVTDALNSSTKSILDSLGKIAARKGSDSGTDSGTDSINLSGVNSRLDKLNKSTSGVSSSVDSFGGRFSEYAKSQAAYRSADSLTGKGWQDSVNKAISGGSDGSWNSDSTSLFNSNSSQASTNKSAIESEMSALKTDLKSSSCTEFPPFTVHLPLFDIDLSLGDEFNRYPALLVVLRMMGRLVGGLAGFLLVLRSLQGRKGD